MAAVRISEIDIHYAHSPVVAEICQGVGEWLKAATEHEAHPSLYDCWNFGKGPHPGDRAPDVHGLSDGTTEPRRLYQHWIGDQRHQLLVFTGKMPNTERVEQLAELAVSVEAESGGLIHSRVVRPADVPGTPGDLVDHDGEAHYAYGARYECLYLVRPDAYVGFRSQPADKESLRRYLKEILTRP
jgi:hypothetical protein